MRTSILLVLAWITAVEADEAPKLLLYYDFEQVTDGRVTDLANPAVSGKLMGGDPSAIRLDEDSPLGAHSKALYCDPDRNGDETTYIDSGRRSDILGVNRSSYTMMAWVFPLTRNDLADGSDSEAVFGQKTNQPLSFSLTLGTNKRNQIRSMHGGWDTGFSSGSNVVERQTWQHLTWIYEDGKMTYLKNGENVSIPQFPDQVLVPLEHASAITIGTTETSDPERFRFAGFIDDVRIYSGTLSPEEVATIISESQDQAMRISSSLTNDQARVQWTNVPNALYDIESSTDLVEWRVLRSQVHPIQRTLEAFGDLPGQHYFRIRPSTE